MTTALPSPTLPQPHTRPTEVRINTRQTKAWHGRSLAWEVTMPRRICLGCGTLTDGTRCTECQRPRERATLQAKRQRRPRPSHAEDRRRAAAVAAHRRERGDWCPGWQREPHEATDLTADHIDAVAAGGAETGDLQVLCRSCNSAKGAR